MARPLKTGIEYFPLDVGIFDDDKVLLVTSAKGGAKAESLIIRLLCKIYKEGYYCTWSEDQNLLMKKAMSSSGCDEDWIKEVVEKLIERDFFDRKSYEEFNILTSRAIQRRYLLATKGRKIQDDNRPFWLLSSDETLDTVVSPQETPVNPQETLVSNPHGTQSRVEYIKVDKTKRKDSRVEDDHPDTAHPFFLKYQEFIKAIAEKYPTLQDFDHPLRWREFGTMYEYMCKTCPEQKKRDQLISQVLREMFNKRPLLTEKYGSFIFAFDLFMSKKVKINRDPNLNIAINTDGTFTSKLKIK